MTSINLVILFTISETSGFKCVSTIDRQKYEKKQMSKSIGKLTTWPSPCKRNESRCDTSSGNKLFKKATKISMRGITQSCSMLRPVETFLRNPYAKSFRCDVSFRCFPIIIVTDGRTQHSSEWDNVYTALRKNRVSVHISDGHMANRLVNNRLSSDILNRRTVAIVWSAVSSAKIVLLLIVHA